MTKLICHQWCSGAGTYGNGVPTREFLRKYIYIIASALAVFHCYHMLHIPCTLNHVKTKPQNLQSIRALKRIPNGTCSAQIYIVNGLCHKIPKFPLKVLPLTLYVSKRMHAGRLARAPLEN